MRSKATRETRLEAMAGLCRQRGGRFTPQRRAVLEKLLAAHAPQTAYELRDTLLSQDAAITPASVYRSLEFLIGHGLVHRLETTRSFVACDHPEHAHLGQFLICRQCGTVVEAEDQHVASATSSLGARLGFDVDHPTVELTGVCAACRTDERSRPVSR